MFHSHGAVSSLHCLHRKSKLEFERQKTGKQKEAQITGPRAKREGKTEYLEQVYKFTVTSVICNYTMKSQVLTALSGDSLTT